MKTRSILTALLLMVAGLQTAWAQGFRVYNSDGTVLQFSLRTDSIVFYDDIGSEQDLGLFTPVNQMIVGTWYKSKSESVTFYENGTTNFKWREYDDHIGVSYEFFPFQGNLVIYSSNRRECNLYHVAKLTKDSMIIVGEADHWIKSFIYTRTQPKQLIEEIVLNETSITLKQDEVKILTATILPEDADNPTVVWESSNEDVAEINKDGRVIANANGQCTITCRATDGSGVYAECKVTVSENLTFTAVLSARNGNGTTRALVDSDGTFNASWAVGEQIAIVFAGNKYTATVTDVDDGGNATVTATLPSSTPNNQAVSFIYPASAADGSGLRTDLLASQDGTLETLSSEFDVRTVEGTIIVDGDKALSNSTIILVPQFAICEFSFIDENNQLITAITRVIITDLATSEVITVTMPTAQSVIYVAMKSVNNSMKFEVETSDGSIHTKTVNAYLKAGNFYRVSVRLSTN